MTYQFARTSSLFVAVFCVFVALKQEIRALDDVTTSVKTVIIDPGSSQGFSRGDANQDGGTDISDAVFVLSYLFGGTATSCEAALDANDDEAVNIADAVYLLSYLFAGSAPPPFPFGPGVCGSDPTAGSLTCSSFNSSMCTVPSDTRLVSLLHNGGMTISLPLVVFVEAIQGAGVTLVNPDGVRNQEPYFDYSGFVPGGVFVKDTQTKARQWEFHNPQGADFSLSLRIEGTVGTRGWLPGSGLTREGTELPGRIIQKLEPASIRYKIEVPGFTIKQRTLQIGAKAERFQSLNTPLRSVMRSVGKPALPTHTQLVAVPKNARVVTTVTTGKPLQYDNYRIIPAQLQPVDEEGVPDPPFLIDEKLYSRDEFYPQELISTTEGMMRGMRILAVRTSLSRYNGGTGKLHVYPDIEVEIEFEDVPVKGPSSFAGEDERSPGFEHILQTSLLNQSQAVLGAELVANNRIYFDLFRDFLIITDPDFEDAALELADWKIDQGIRTMVATTDATGTTTDEIADYIRLNYTLRGIEYVLLFGDAEHIPTFYESRHPVTPPYGHSPLSMASDLYYVTIDGPTPAGTRDYFPDMVIGRLPVDTAAEAETIVAVIKDYEAECGPNASADFYTNAALAAYFQDDPPEDGTADRGYSETIETIATFLSGEGYTPNRVFWTWNDVDPEEWHDGTGIPNYLKRAHGFDWDGTGDDIVNLINDGTFMLAHRDHGSRSGWTYPSFTSNDTEDLTNGSKRPAVFSINCQTGWFDNETDEAGYNTDADSECFAEHLLREPEGGALAVFAPTRNSPSWANNHLLLGMLDCIWPTLLPGFPGDDAGEAGELAGSRRLGHILNYGKLRVFAEYGDDPPCNPAGWACDNLDDITMSQFQFEMYHCLGDPTLQLKVTTPMCLTVVLPVFELNQPEYTIPVNPAYEGALIAVRQGDDLVGQAFVHDSEVTIPLRETLNPQEPAFVVLNKEGYAPLVTEIAFPPTCSLYVFEVPEEEGKISVGVYSVSRNGGIQRDAIESASGTGSQLCCNSGFTGTEDYLFAGANQKNLINMFRFGSGGAISPVRGSPFTTTGIRPTVLTANAAGSTLYALTDPDMLEVFEIGENTLTQAMDPVTLQPAAWGLAVLTVKILRPPFSREFVYVGNWIAGQAPSGIMVFEKGDQALETIQVFSFKESATRPGKKLCIAPEKGFLYCLDLDSGIFLFSIDKSTGELAMIGKEPFALGGFCNEIRLAQDGALLFASLPFLQNGPQIIAYAVQNNGSLEYVDACESSPLITSLRTSCDGRFLYGASRYGDGIAAWEILKNGTLEYLGLTPDGTKETAPGMLWTRSTE